MHPATDVRVRLPRPYALQREIIDSPAKRKVICAGRRAGKTVMAAFIACERLLRGQQVLLSSTSQDQADVSWLYARRWLAPLTQAKLAKKNEVRRTIAFQHGLLTVKTGRDPDSLRGAFADLLVLDECAYLDPAAWYEVGAPMLADRNGDAIFISTPKRRNWFFDLYGRALADDTGRWQAWSFPTHTNPHLSAEALADLAADMTEDSYRQEIMAEFLESSGAVFRRIDEAATLPALAPYPGDFVVGVDWAQKSDYTAIIVMDRGTRHVVAMDRFNGVSWALQRGRLRALVDAWQPALIVAESNSIGGPNIEALQAEGLPVIAFETTGISKPPLIESLVLAFERAEIGVLNDPVLRHELMAYERKVTASGRSQYSAPEGMHDDTVIALALAWHALGLNPEIGIYENTFFD